ncbi:hypothetical protein IFM89_022012 [Coptis chinensis]|uniref:Ubiquitin-like protease family profile domain-containing protein n=1 Tax=Coptis chinensis TaxID=261450 RepID=A0A835LZ40_9MAGN|nr:hypothetical protein IFM89_022012 [Coptis chinensis]
MIKKGRLTPRAVRRPRKIAGYEGALARVMVPLNAFSDWRKLKDFWGGQLEKDLWATMQMQNCRLTLGSKDKIVAKGKMHTTHLWLGPEKWVIVGDKDMVDDSSAANGEVASQLQKFGKIIEKMMKSSQISIPLEKGVFEEEIAFNYFLKSDLLDVCNMKKLEVNSMTAYLRFSTTRFESSRAKYGFFHPSHFNDFGDREEMKRNLIKRMKVVRKDQLIFVPYSTMGHWLLLVIDMTSMEVFWLDSMVRKAIDLDVKFIVNDAMKVAAMEMGKRTKGNPTWELVKALGYPWGYTVKLYAVKAVRRDTDLIKVTSLLEQCSSQGLKGNLIYVIDVSGHALSSPAFGWAMRYVGSLVRTEARKALVGELE